jgi:predicted heme/steroid binding protein
MKSLAVCLLLTLCAVSSSAALLPAGDDDNVAAITKLENDAVKADMAVDSSFYDKLLADDWTGGTSRGTFDTKQSFLADMKDPKSKMNSEKVSDIKVRSYGDAAVATYTNTYDAMMKGKHYARTVVCTDFFQKQGGDWKQIANHCSMGVK